MRTSFCAVSDFSRRQLAANNRSNAATAFVDCKRLILAVALVVCRQTCPTACTECTQYTSYSVSAAVTEFAPDP
jgi:hypothetical protein